MYTLTRSGSVEAAIREVRDIPARVIPYAASTALTRTAQAAKAEIVAEMPRVFDRPVAYTLNALLVVPSTVQTMAARVAVKDQSGGRGVRPESYLLPEVEGGGRNEKRFERALRYAGVLAAGERAMPGDAVERDAAGNVSSAVIRAVLREVKALQRKGKDVAPKRRPKGAAGLRPVIFAGVVGRRQTRGIWQREGRRTRPLFIFTRRLPQYRRRLDFVGIAERVARDIFPAAFKRAAEDIMLRRR